MSFITKIFAPKLVSNECIPNRRWVHKNFWGNRRVVERYDAVIPPVQGDNIYDSDFVSKMRKVHIDVTSIKTTRNDKVEKIVEQRKPIYVTTCKIEDDAHPENNKVIGFIKTGDMLWTYYKNIFYDGCIPIFEPVNTKEIQKAAREKAQRKAASLSSKKQIL